MSASTTPSESTENDLGELIVLVRTTWLTTVVYALGMTILAAFLAGALLVGLSGQSLSELPPAPKWLPPVFAVGCVAVFIATIIVLRRCVTAFYAEGLHQRGIFGQRTVRYAEVENFSLRLVHHQHAIALYGGTQGALRLVLRRGGDVEATLFRRLHRQHAIAANLFTEMHPFVGLGDMLAQRIAARLLAEIDRDGAAPWVKKVELTRTGLRLPQPLAWHEISKEETVLGEYLIYVAERRRPRCSISMAKVGFYPGYYALAALRGLDQPGAEEWERSISASST